jgi:predicted ester cyclase
MRSDDKSGNEQVVRRLYDHINHNRAAAFEEVVDAEFLDRSNGSQGPDGFARAAANLHRAYKNLNIEVAHIILDADYAAVRWVETGVHTGPFFNLKPTGKPFEARGVTMYRLKDGKIVESWLGIDPGTIRAQQQGQEDLNSTASDR